MKPHHWILAATALVAAVLLLFATGTASGAPRAATDAWRGRALYESHCGGCHADSVHGRAKRQAGDYAAVRAWVVRWRDSLALAWTDAEVDDVAAYVNATYYRYPCPPSICTVVSVR
jgi:mono/diheme cytochrome c family protein